MNPMKKCPECGDPFEQDQPWKKVCLECYLARKERTGERRVKQLEEQVQYWQGIATAQGVNTELTKLEKRCDQLSGELGQARARIHSLELELMRAHAASYTPPPRYQPTPSIPKEIRRFIAQRIHPDRCNDRETATAAMQWLNALME